MHTDACVPSNPTYGVSGLPQVSLFSLQRFLSGLGNVDVRNIFQYLDMRLLKKVCLFTQFVTFCQYLHQYLPILLNICTVPTYGTACIPTIRYSHEGLCCSVARHAMHRNGLLLKQLRSKIPRSKCN